MKKIALFGLVAALAAGCSMKSREIPSAAIPFASADYEVLGATNAEACGTYILGINFATLFAGESGTLPSAALPIPLPLPGLGGGSPEAKTAMYDALGRMPEATHLLAPRVNTEASGILLMGRPLFGKRCSTVEARGVRIGSGPVPNAH